MASKGIRYKVWEEVAPPGADHVGNFWFHCILGNNKIVAPSQGYNEQREAHETIEAIWFDTAIAQKHGNAYRCKTLARDRKAAIQNFAEQHPVPYTKDSLLRSSKTSPSKPLETIKIAMGRRRRPEVKRTATFDKPTNYGRGRTPY